MEKEFNQFKEILSEENLNEKVFQYYYFNKGNQQIGRALDFYFSDKQLKKVYQPQNKSQIKLNAFDRLKEAQKNRESIDKIINQKKYSNKRKSTQQNQKIIKVNSNEENIFENLENLKTINPFDSQNSNQSLYLNVKNSKQQQSKYDQFIEQRKQSKNKRFSSNTLLQNFQKYSNYYLKIGTQQKIIAIKEKLNQRLTSKDKLIVKIVPKPNFNGVPKKLLKKQKKLKGCVVIEYQSFVNSIELANLPFLEGQIFDLLQKKIIIIKSEIVDYDHSYDRDYTFNFHYYIKLQTFKNKNLNIEQIYQDKKSIKKFAEKKQAMIDLFKYLNLSKALDNTELNKKGEVFLKQKFYEQTSAGKNQENFKDFTPKELKLQLYDFQKFGLFWMIQRESPAIEEINDYNSDLHPMWKELCIDFELLENYNKKDEFKNFLMSINQKNFVIENKWYFYFNILSGDVSLNFPYFDIENSFCGGILADEMGLGKTIMMLSLIQFSLSNENKIHIINLKQHYKDQKLKEKNMKIRNQKQTLIQKETQHIQFANNLIVMPAILIQQWWQQSIKTINKKLKILNYNKSDKKKKIDLSQYDIVLTSYETVRQDCFQNDYKRNLFQYCWTRIILDEANRIRNPNAQNSQGIFQLQGISKWCVTGTPLENSIQDLYSLIRFLNYKPWSDRHWWKEYIENPLIKDRNVQALNVLVKITKPIILRRSKAFNADILQLQDIEHIDVKIIMNENERFIYQKRQIKSKQEQENKVQKYKNMPFHIYEIILRLRQICDHSKLFRLSRHEFQVEETAKKFMEKMLERQDIRFQNGIQNNDVKFDFQQISEKIENFKNDESCICVICMENFTEPVLTFCQHFFCKFCLYQNLELTSPECPLCKTQISKKDVYKIQEYFKKLKLQLLRC